MKHVTALVLACLLGAPVAGAQPASEKDDAKALLQSGLRLFTANDFVGALAVFREAYGRYPSPKILLNIGTTLLKLERRAEAANTYQRYLETSEGEGDVAKRDEVTRVLAALDRELGIVELTVTPKDAEIQVGSGEWQPAASLQRTRVATGSITVQGRRTGYRVFTKTLDIGAGETRPLTVALAVDGSASTAKTAGVDGGISARVEPTRSSRFGASVVAHIDPVNLGGAALIGAIMDVTDRVQTQVAALLGPAPGGYIGGSFAILTERVRPLVSVGMPVFISDGPRVAIRAAGGVEFALTRQIALIAELGVEHLFNPEASVTPTLFIPAVGVIGRL